MNVTSEIKHGSSDLTFCKTKATQFFLCKESFLMQLTLQITPPHKMEIGA